MSLASFFSSVLIKTFLLFYLVLLDFFFKFNDRRWYSITYFTSNLFSYVYKVQFVCDFLGRIIAYSGPHLGLCYNEHLCKQIEEKMEETEFIMGNGHYIANHKVIIQYRQQSRKRLREL